MRKARLTQVELPIEIKHQLFDHIEEERRRIADIIHDQLCQTLTTLSMVVERIGKGVDAGRATTPEMIESLRKLVDDIIGDARALSFQFNPTGIEGWGLMKALDELAKRMNGEFTCEQAVFVADRRTAITLLGIATAAIEDAGGILSRPSIQLAQKPDELVMTMSANGLGRDPTREGLLSARASMLGGNVRIQKRTKGNRVKLICTIPQSGVNRSGTPAAESGVAASAKNPTLSRKSASLRRQNKLSCKPSGSLKKKV